MRPPRAADGRPDLSGVWMHEVATVAEFRRLFGALTDEAIKVDVPAWKSARSTSTGSPEASGRLQPAGVPRLLGWTMGARHVRRRDSGIQRPDRARRDGSCAQRPAARDRALPPPRLRAPGRGDDVRRS